MFNIKTCFKKCPFLMTHSFKSFVKPAEWRQVYSLVQSDTYDNPYTHASCYLLFDL